MPRYDFACNKCDHRFERVCPFSEIEDTECPNCGSSKVKKVIKNPQYVKTYGRGYHHKDTGDWS